MDRRYFISFIGAAATWPITAYAETAPRPIIGFLSSRSAKDSVKLVAAFKKGMTASGFSEGKDYSMLFRFADGQLDALPEIAADLVRQNAAILVAVGSSNSALAAKRATSKVPVVFVIGGDPIKLGLGASLSRPGGNATGMTIISGDLEPKRLGLLLELVPNAKM